MCARADRQCHNTMIQKHLEFGEMESFAHIVHKVEDLLQKGEDSKTGKKTMLIRVLIVSVSYTHLTLPTIYSV